MRADAEFDIIVYGATGFTGRLVAEHLVRQALLHALGQGPLHAQARGVEDVVQAPDLRGTWLGESNLGHRGKAYPISWRG